MIDPIIYKGILTKILAIALAIALGIQTMIQPSILGGVKMSLEQKINNAPANQRADIKAAEVVKDVIAETFVDSKYGQTIEIRNVTKIPRGVEVLARAWVGQKQLGFGKDGSIEIERFQIFNPPVLVDDQTGTILRSSINLKGQVTVRHLREDPAQALRETLAHTIHVSGKLNTQIVVGKTGHTSATVYPDPSHGSTTTDGTPERDASVSWTDTRSGSGTGTTFDDANVRFVLHTFKIGAEFLNRRPFATFDTSVAGAGATINSGTLSMAGNGDGITNPDSTSAALEGCTPAANNAVAASDYTAYTSLDAPTEFATRINFASLVDTAGTYNDFTLNSNGLSNINPAGVSCFMFRTGKNDIDNNAPTGDNLVIWRSADTSGTSSDPKLVFDYTVAATVSPVSEDILIFQ